MYNRYLFESCRLLKTSLEEFAVNIGKIMTLSVSRSISMNQYCFHYIHLKLIEKEGGREKEREREGDGEKERDRKRR